MATASARPRPMIIVVRTAFSASGLRPMASMAARTPTPMATAGPRPPNPIAMAAAMRRIDSSSSPWKFRNILALSRCVPLRQVRRQAGEDEREHGEDDGLDEAEEQLHDHERDRDDGERHHGH